jgi:hypothetical protein
MSNSYNPVEQAVINQEADRWLLATLIYGLVGMPGRQVRLQIPKTVEKALNMAIIVTIAKKEEKASVRENRGTSVRVFAVGGNLGEMLERKYEKPQGKFQWSRNRGRGA